MCYGILRIQYFLLAHCKKSFLCVYKQNAREKKTDKACIKYRNCLYILKKNAFYKVLHSPNKIITIFWIR